MTQRRLRFLEFIFIGVCLGILEDLLAIKLATSASIDLTILAVVVGVAIPFAFLSEIVVDHPRFWQRLFPGFIKWETQNPILTEKRLRWLEFLVIGIGMGITEDMIAVLLATGESFSWHILWIVVIVAIPFAFISEIVVDHPKFWKYVFPRFFADKKNFNP